MSPQRKIGLFLSLTFGFSLLVYPLILRAGTDSPLDLLFVFVLMWSPGLAAILTQLIATRSLRGLGWRPGPARWLGLAYLLPVMYALPLYGLVWLSGLGQFGNPRLFARIAEQYSSPNLATTIAIYVVLQATVGMAENLISGLGEEIGWRGLLVPELAKVTTFTKTALISGAIWAAWHMPAIFLAGYNSGSTPTWYAATWFAILIIATSFAYAWLRLKSGSLWPAAVLHASHNLFIMMVFDRLTAETAITPYITGEFGAGLALTGLVVAYVFWRLQRDKSRQIQPIPAQPAAQPGLSSTQ